MRREGGVNLKHPVEIDGDQRGIGSRLEAGVSFENQEWRQKRFKSPLFSDSTMTEFWTCFCWGCELQVLQSTRRPKWIEGKSLVSRGWQQLQTNYVNAMRFPNFTTAVFLVIILTSFLSARVLGRLKLVIDHTELRQSEGLLELSQYRKSDEANVLKNLLNR